MRKLIKFGSHIIFTHAPSAALTCDIKEISSLAKEVQSVEHTSLSMPPSLTNRLSSFDRNNTFVSGTDVVDISSVSLSQFLLNQSLEGEREKGREGRRERGRMKHKGAIVVRSGLLALRRSEVSFLQQFEGGLLPPAVLRRRRGEREEN